jgi:hypothetical protein
MALHTLALKTLSWFSKEPNDPVASVRPSDHGVTPVTSLSNAKLDCEIERKPFDAKHP